jgi:hypothetical protein
VSEDSRLSLRKKKQEPPQSVLQPSYRKVKRRARTELVLVGDVGGESGEVLPLPLVAHAEERLQEAVRVLGHLDRPARAGVGIYVLCVCIMYVCVVGRSDWFV